jgi:ABC-type nitrate/sulfonate/bicarbonate transport system permease component
VTESRLARALLPIAGLGVVIGAWALLVDTDVLPKSSVATPSATWRSLRELVSDGAFWTRAGQTGWSWLVGLLVAAVIGIPLGVLLGASPKAARFTRVVVEAVRPIPPVVILPLALLVLGGALWFKVSLIVQGALWPLVIQTSYGVRSIDPVVLETAASFRLDPVRRLFLVRIPAASVQIATGLRLAAATAFAVCLVAEIVGGAKGIGAELISAQITGDVAGVMALTVIAGVFGMVIALVFGQIERRVLRWAPAGRA